MKLYSMDEMAKLSNVTREAIKQRIDVRKIKPYTKVGMIHLFTENQKNAILQRLKQPNYIYVIESYEYFESKINRPRNTYGTHSHFNRKK